MCMVIYWNFSTDHSAEEGPLDEMLSRYEVGSVSDFIRGIREGSLRNPDSQGGP